MRKRPPIYLIFLLALILGFTSAAAGFALPAYAAAGANLDQWANDPGQGWQNGNINDSNSAYAEGDVVPFRLAINGLTAGTHSIHLNWDLTVGNPDHAAYDFLATYNATEDVDLCAAGGGGVSALCPTLPTVFDLPFFTDTLTVNGTPVSGAYDGTPRMMKLYGVSAASWGALTYPDGGTYKGDAVLNFTSTGTDVLLVWGGHIAETAYWGPEDPQGAGMLTGSPWHMSAQNLDSGGGANQDRSISVSALTHPVLTITKYLDANSNGQKDPGETTLLSGWSFTIRDSKDHVVDTVTTGAGGTVSTTLTDGDLYTIVETVQAGWTNTDPGGATPSKEVLAPRGTTTNVIFGNHENATQLRVFKYNDLDNDGTRDLPNGTAGEPGLSGWSFTVTPAPLIDAVQSVLPTPITLTTGSDPLGYSPYTTLAPGRYEVCENTPPALWSITDPREGNCKIVTVDRGASETVIFGDHFSGATLRVFKFNDLDNDGTRDLPNGTAGEPGLSGWSFSVSPAPIIELRTALPTPITLTTGSDPLGYSPYTTLAPGRYQVCENTPLPANWAITYPREGYCQYVTLEEGQAETVTFGNHYTPPPVPDSGTLQVGKYNDTDRDGVRDGTEAGLSGWSFQVRLGTALLSTLVTDSSGLAAISLAPGTYTVTEVTQTGWTSTDPGGATPTKTVVVTAGQLTGVIFGNAITIIPPTTQTQLTVTKYADANANSLRDTGEGVLAGFSFTVRSSDGAIVQTITTDANGIASIASLPLATYTVTETARDGWTNTDPGGNATKTFTFTSTNTSVALSFGNAQIRLPSTATDDGTTGLTLTLVLIGGIALMFLMARRVARPS